MLDPVEIRCCTILHQRVKDDLVQMDVDMHVYVYGYGFYVAKGRRKIELDHFQQANITTNINKHVEEIGVPIVDEFLHNPPRNGDRSFRS